MLLLVAIAAVHVLVAKTDVNAAREASAVVVKENVSARTAHVALSLNKPRCAETFKNWCSANF